MLVCRFFTPGNREEDQAPARKAFYETALHFGIAQFIEIPTQGDYGYQRALCFAWEAARDSTNSLVIVEQDLVLNPRHIEAFDACGCSLCARAYTIFPKSTMLSKPVYAHRRYTGNQGGLRWIKEPESAADLVGLGLVRIRYNALVKNDVWELLPGAVHHTNCDTALSMNLHARHYNWHIHWPKIEHLHK